MNKVYSAYAQIRVLMIILDYLFAYAAFVNMLFLRTAIYKMTIHVQKDLLKEWAILRCLVMNTLFLN